MNRSSAMALRGEVVREISQMPSGSRRRYSEALKEKIRLYAQATGLERKELCHDLGLSSPTMDRILRGKTMLRPVRVIEDAVPSHAQVNSLSLRTPSGLEISGLVLEDAIALVRALT